MEGSSLVHPCSAFRGSASLPVGSRSFSTEGNGLVGVAFCEGGWLQSKVVHSLTQVLSLHSKFNSLKPFLCLVIPAEAQRGWGYFVWGEFGGYTRIPLVQRWQEIKTSN